MKNQENIRNDVVSSEISLTGEEAIRANGKYCISTGEKTLHHLDFQQLENLHGLLSNLYETKLMGTAPPYSTEENVEIEIQKDTILYGNETSPYVSYSVYTEDCDIQMISYARLKKISDLLQVFLLKFTKEDYSIPDTGGKITPSEQNPSDIPFRIWEDPEASDKHSIFKEVVNINQRIVCKSSLSNIQTHYMVSANELYSNWLTLEQLNILYHELDSFLKKEKRNP